MPVNERRFWPNPAKHNHVLGELKRVEYGSGRMTALVLYESAVACGDEPAEIPKTRAIVVGSCRQIRCTICGQTVDWDEPPIEAYQRLMARYANGSKQEIDNGNNNG